MSRTLVDAYGLDERQRRDLVPLLVRRARSMHDFLAEQSAAGVLPWTRLWDDGHGETWRRDAEHIGDRAADWTAALLD
ncbi:MULTISPECIES: hypothetical protein [unclassified Micromonospora]|uniref:hypothetical protein n=1 Tax=unclassified Micromonospora TaxID=2617518 RepID=UPI003A8C008E